MRNFLYYFMFTFYIFSSSIYAEIIDVNFEDINHINNSKHGIKDYKKFNLDTRYSAYDSFSILLAKYKRRAYDDDKLGGIIVGNSTNYDIKHEIDNQLASLANGSVLIIDFENHGHATGIIIFKTNAGEKRAFFVNPYGSSRNDLRNILNDDIEIFNLNFFAQNSFNDPKDNSCGAYLAEIFHEMIVAFNDGKITKEEFLSHLKSKNWKSDNIRSQHYKLLTGEDPPWKIATQTPDETPPSSIPIISKEREVTEKNNNGSDDIKNTADVTPYQEAYNKITEQIILSSMLSSLKIIHINSKRINYLSAISSGDSSLQRQHGLWGEGFIEIAKQKKNNRLEEFETLTKGYAIGADIENERYIAGISYISMGSITIFAQNKDNLFNDSSSHIGVLYGSYLITQNLQILWQFGYGFTNLTLQNKEKKDGKLKFGSIEGNYFYAMTENHNLIPKLGVQLISADYKDKDKEIVNISKAIISLGVGANTNIVTQDLYISPEIYVGGEYITDGEGEKAELALDTDFRLNIIKSSNLKASFAVNYRKKAGFYSVMGSMQLAISF